MVAHPISPQRLLALFIPPPHPSPQKPTGLLIDLAPKFHFCCQDPSHIIFIFTRVRLSAAPCNVYAVFKRAIASHVTHIFTIPFLQFWIHPQAVGQARFDSFEYE